ncbi:hypothetical protein GGR27_001363 [Lewinella antarctica]|uniref:Uncharacterized protein n=1 Tax=Neolewinella antarctica TaxID=442734 RepID=A0ABX0XA84_9BACT|nr:hypothetical protein [Neolewinella antarctica]
MEEDVVVWYHDVANRSFFYSKQHDRSKTWLRMNDFPDEPLYTLHANGCEVHFDDLPKPWTVKFYDD